MFPHTYKNTCIHLRATPLILVLDVPQGFFLRKNPTKVGLICKKNNHVYMYVKGYKKGYTHIHT